MHSSDSENEPFLSVDVDVLTGSEVGVKVHELGSDDTAHNYHPEGEAHYRGSDASKHPHDLRIKDCPKANAANGEFKYPLTSVFGITVLCLGTMLYGSLSTVTRLSFLGGERPLYNSSAVLVVSEIVKFVASLTLLNFEMGVQKAIRTILAQSWKQWLVFAVPASIYSVTNVLDFYIVQYMDPGTMAVLVQFKILTTAVLWWLWFKKAIGKQQWLALTLLLFGCMFAAFPRDVSEGGAYVLWPWGPLYVLLQVTLSALAGVYTEAVYKDATAPKRSIHLENLSMYFWGVAANSVQYFAKGGWNYGLLNNFNVFTWLLVAIFASIGLVLAQVMKHFSNIIKLFMTGASVVVAGVLSLFVLGIPWNWMFATGLALVVCSIYLYKTERKFIFS